MFRFISPLILCFIGIYFSFFHFWHGFDAISGDIGDARFNAYVLEHTWLWITGIHASLFDMPMFYPHSNTYAYSDFMLGFAPCYWFFRWIGCEILLSYQWWMIVCCALNFVVFLLFLKTLFKHSIFFASIGAYVFAFSLPRITHFEHVQLVGQFFIVLSAAGALLWWKEPTSKKAPWLFFTGSGLQLISAFYFFWFWVWTLGIYLSFILMNRNRRKQFNLWFKSVPKGPLIIAGGISFLGVAPFLYHYVLMAKEFGRRDWVSISNTVPRIYSWINLPQNHWQWKLLPMKEWIQSLPRIEEHYLSFGLFTWIAMLAAFTWVVQNKKELRYLVLPILGMFIFTLTSGRFSTWVLISYLFPGGGAIRAVGRIQIFMLLFWATIFISFVSFLWNSQNKRNKTISVLMILFLMLESTYISDWNFSRAQDQLRLEQISKNIPADCNIIVNREGFNVNSDLINIDAVMIAFKTNRITANGYSGHQPKDFRDSLLNQKWNESAALDGKKVCEFKNTSI